MPTSYTSLLGLALPVTGELSGTWGDTVNNFITQYLDSSVAGTQVISGSQTAVTLSVTTNASLTQVGAGASGSAQYGIIRCSGNPASTLTITAPAASKSYLIINATSTNQSVKIVGTGPTTGVTLVAGESAVVAWNGSDFVKVSSSAVDGVSTIAFGTTGLTPSAATSGAVTVAGTLVAANGGTGQSTYTTGDLLYATGSTALSKLGIGTNGQILTSTGTAPQWTSLSSVGVTTFSAGTTGFTPSTATSGAVTLAGTLATTNGGTGLTSFTANRVFYSSSTSAIGSSANLTFDGTTLTANALTTTSTVTINGGTANGVAYLNGSKVLTTGSALTFDGTNLGLGGAPSAWGANYKAIQNPAGAIAAYTTSSVAYAQNAYDSGIGAWKYLNTGAAGFYNQSGGSHVFYTAASGTAGAAISFSQVMTLDASGNLGVGTTSPSYRLDVSSASTPVARFTGAANAYVDFSDGTVTTRLQNSGALLFGTTSNHSLLLRTNSTTQATLDTSGNWGLGVTPSAWGASKFAMQLGARASLYGANNLTILANNYYDNGTNNIYIATAAASDYYQSAGSHVWRTAASGTAGTAISFTQAMTLDLNGNLLVGTTGQINSARLSVADSALKTSSSNTMAFGTATGGATDFQLIFARSAAGSGAYYSIQSVEQSTAYRDLVLQQNGGNVGIGTTSPTAKLTVSGGNVAVNVGIYTATNGGNAVQFGAAGQLNFGGGGSDLILATNGANVRFGNWNTNTEFMRLTSVSNLSLGGTADRGTTVGTNAIQIFNGTAPAGTLTNGVSLYSQSGDLRFMDAAGNASLVGYRGIPQSGSAKTTSYTLATTDVGEFIQISTGGSIVIPNSTFAAGDVVSLFNNTTGTITITCSTTNAYIAGTDTNKASMTLATRGVATILFVTSTLCVVSGNVT